MAPVRQAAACASCGSGSDDPLILAPDESFKVYVAASRTGDYSYLEPGGAAGFSVGPVAKDVFTVAAGKSLGPQAFMTITVPTMRNLCAGADRWGLSDPLLALRWTALPQSFVTPWVPQVQVLAACKAALVPSAQDSVDGERLDVFGSGEWEARGGLDVWWGMWSWKFGAAFTAAFPFAHRWLDDTVQGGLRLRGTVTVGYGRDGLGRLVAGVVREDQGDSRLNGRSLRNSGHGLHSLFATADATLTPFDTLRLGVSRAAAFWSENTSQANAVTLAYMRAW